MPEQLQTLLETIKDYGAAIISTVSVGGIAAVAKVIMSVKDSVAKNKEEMSNLVNKETKTTLEIKDQLNKSIEQTNELQRKLDKLCNKIDKIEDNE